MKLKEEKRKMQYDQCFRSKKLAQQKQQEQQKLRDEELKFTLKQLDEVVRRKSKAGERELFWRITGTRQERINLSLELKKNGYTCKWVADTNFCSYVSDLFRSNSTRQFHFILRLKW